jgi:DNA-directed RNA polymerase specialized sigma24 family protein
VNTPGSLTAEQWGRVHAELPAAHKLAEIAGRQCSHLSKGLLHGIAEDALIRAVRRHDPSRGSLLQLARKGIFGGVLRAAYPRWQAGTEAAVPHEEPPEEMSLAERIAETPEDLAMRIAAKGERWVAEAVCGSATQPTAESPEDALIRLERWRELKRVAGADGRDPKAARVIELLYEHEATWEQVATDVDVCVATAKVLKIRALDRIRVHLGSPRRMARPSLHS